MPKRGILRGFLRISSNFDLKLGMTVGASTLFILSIFVHPMSANLNSNQAKRASIGPLAINQNEKINQVDMIDPQRHAEMIRTEYERRRAKRASQKSNPQSSVPTWVSIGPFNAAGRITALAPHPTQVGTIYAGADGGGVWKTIDGGASWTPLTDDISNLSIGAVALAPSSPETVYVGTGSERVLGIGIIKSTDGGATWQFPARISTRRVFKISVHPVNDKELVVGTSEGGFRSVDGGNSWSMVIGSTTTALEVRDIVRDPTNPLVVYATTFSAVRASVLKSTDGGVTWIPLTNGLPSTDPDPFLSVSNMALAISPSDPRVLYVACAIMDHSPANSHIFKTNDAGQSWVDLTGLADSLSGKLYLSAQASHDNTIVVSPNDPNIIYGGGTFYVRSTDGGVTWSSNATITNNTPHFDATDLKYQAGVLYIANDGGIWSSHDDGQTFAALNNNLVAREYYSLAIDAADRNRVLAASQDNGGDRRPDVGGPTWDRFSPDSDLFSVEINRDVPAIGYATTLAGFISRVPLNAASTQDDFFVNSVTPPYTASENPFAGLFGVTVPGRIVLDSTNPNIIYTVSSRVWKSVNDGTDWSPLPTTTTDGTVWGTQRIEALAVSASDGNRIMVGKYSLKPSSSGEFSHAVFSSIDAGQTWRRTDIPAVFIFSLEYDPQNPDIAYLSGLVDHFLLFTSDGGKTWAPRDNGLPGVVVNVIRVDPGDSNVIYCGTEMGVYRSTDKGMNWSRFGEGLPSISIRDIRILEDGSVIRVATFGRGVWEIQFPSNNHSPTAKISQPIDKITVSQGSTVLFNGSVSDVDAGDSVSAIWSFTDTGEQTHTGGGATSASHIFNKAGIFLAGLTAVDNHGSRGAIQVQVTVSQTFDSCDTPFVIPGDGPFPFSITVNPDAATGQQSDPQSCAGNERTLWFEFTPATSGAYTLTATSRLFQPLLSVWTGFRCGPYSGQGFCDLQPTFSADAGVPLHIMTSVGSGQTTLTLSKAGAPCQYALSFASTLHTVSGGSGSVDVLTTNQCSWSASSDVDWIRIDSGATGSGRDRVDYFVLPGPGTTRIGHLTIAGRPIRIVQLATQSTNGQIGDLNADGVIDVGDLIRLANFLAGNTTVDKSLADVLQDNVVDVRDLLTLANFLAGNIHSLPVIPNASASSATPVSSFATTDVIHIWTDKFKYDYIPAIGWKAP